MVAESIPARRPVLSLVLSLLLASGSVAVLGAPAQALQATGQAAISPVTVPDATPQAVVVEPDVTLSLAPALSAVLLPGQDLQLTATITNGTAEPLTPSALNVYLAARALTTRTALEDWLRPDDAGSPGDVILSQPTLATILPGNSETIALTVPAASVGLSTQNAWGARGLAATVSAGDTEVAQGRSTLVWAPTAPVEPVNVAMIMPITTPAGTVGLIPSQALETYTAPTGLLTRQLDGVFNRPVAIAIDPMIIASIRVLGSAAPASAVEWLNRLARATNEIFPLGYADADIALEVQAGAAALLGPTSFEQAIDPANFSTPTPGPGATEAPGDGPIQPQTGTPTDEPDPAPAGTPPSTGELLAWDYTATNIAWPAEGSVTTADLDVFAAGGLTTTIIAGSQVAGQGTGAPNAAISLGDSVGLAVDDPLSDAIRLAAKATTDDEWQQAMAEALAQLAVVAQDSSASHTLLATFDRGWPPTSARLTQTIDALASFPWKASVSLQQALESPRTPNVAFQGEAQPDARVALATQLLRREAEVGAFATAATEPIVITGTHRLDLLALLATSWAPQADAWTKAVNASLAASGTLLQSIAVTTRGPVNVLASQVDIPVTLSNSLPQAVTVRVHLVPSNGRLVVGSDIDATIDAESAQTIKVPVSAKVGNGDVVLRVSVFSPTGVPVGVPGLVDVNVQAEWEGVGAVIFAMLVVLFFGFGVWRNIVRRRRERSEPDAPGAEEATHTTDPSHG